MIINGVVDVLRDGTHAKAPVGSTPFFQQYPESLTYDAVGNRLTGPTYTKTFGYTQSYTYDYDNRLTGVTKQIGGAPDPDIITFKYDPFGRRIEKSISTVENGVPTTYKYTYVYDNEDIILEVLDKTQDGTTVTTTTSFIHGPGIDEPLSLERNSQKYYYHADGLGSITSVTDSTQSVVNRYSYDSFGNVQRTETVWNDFTYTGREYDSETGLLFLRARYYNPEVGRFVSKDPIGFAGGDVNVYNYVLGNPVNWVDPVGLVNVSPAGTNPFGSSGGGGYLGGGGLGGGGRGPIGGGGRGGNVNKGASCPTNSAEAAKYRKSLASEQQMGEEGFPIAGSKTSVPLREATNLSKKYGGAPDDWVKKTSSSYKSPDGTMIQTHWYENVKTGHRVEYKTKIGY